MIILAQDSEKISASTTQIIKSVAERLLSVLDDDTTVTYNFAFAMYAEHLNISSFGNKATTLSYMNGLFSQTKQQRNNGDKNLLRPILNKTIQEFQSRPTDNKKVSFA